MDAKSKRGCLWAAAGAGLLILMLGAALFGGAAWLVYQTSSMKSSAATPQKASEAFDTARARFAGQTPLIAIDEQEHARLVPRANRSDAAVSTLHVIAFDAVEGRLRHVTLPFWLLRLAPGRGELQIGDESLRSLRGTRLTIKDVEDAGPGLLVDHSDREGRRVLVWTE